MKLRLFFMLMLWAVVTAQAASPADAPFITAQSNKLNKRIAADVASGKLTKDDGDKLSARVSHVQSVVETEERLTPAIRQNLRNELARIAKDIGEKESPAAPASGETTKSGFFGNPSPSP